MPSTTRLPCIPVSIGTTQPSFGRREEMLTKSKGLIKLDQLRAPPSWQQSIQTPFGAEKVDETDADNSINVDVSLLSITFNDYPFQQK